MESTQEVESEQCKRFRAIEFTRDKSAHVVQYHGFYNVFLNLATNEKFLDLLQVSSTDYASLSPKIKRVYEILQSLRANLPPTVNTTVQSNVDYVSNRNLTIDALKTIATKVRLWVNLSGNIFEDVIDQILTNTSIVTFANNVTEKAPRPITVTKTITVPQPTRRPNNSAPDIIINRRSTTVSAEDLNRIKQLEALEAMRREEQRRRNLPKKKPIQTSLSDIEERLKQVDLSDRRAIETDIYLGDIYTRSIQKKPNILDQFYEGMIGFRPTEGDTMTVGRLVDVMRSYGPSIESDQTSLRILKAQFGNIIDMITKNIDVTDSISANFKALSPFIKRSINEQYEPVFDLLRAYTRIVAGKNLRLECFTPFFADLDHLLSLLGIEYRNIDILNDFYTGKSFSDQGTAQIVQINWNAVCNEVITEIFKVIDAIQDNISKRISAGNEASKTTGSRKDLFDYRRDTNCKDVQFNSFFRLMLFASLGSDINFESALHYTIVFLFKHFKSTYFWDSTEGKITKPAVMFFLLRDSIFLWTIPTRRKSPAKFHRIYQGMIQYMQWKPFIKHKNLSDQLIQKIDVHIDEFASKSSHIISLLSLYDTIFETYLTTFDAKPFLALTFSNNLKRFAEFISYREEPAHPADDRTIDYILKSISSDWESTYGSEDFDASKSLLESLSDKLNVAPSSMDSFKRFLRDSVFGVSSKSLPEDIGEWRIMKLHYMYPFLVLGIMYYRELTGVAGALKTENDYKALLASGLILPTALPPPLVEEVIVVPETLLIPETMTVKEEETSPIRIQGIETDTDPIFILQGIEGPVVEEPVSELEESCPIPPPDVKEEVIATLGEAKSKSDRNIKHRIVPVKDQQTIYNWS